MERAPLRLACVSGPVDIDGVARPVDSGSRAGAAARIHTAYRATVRRRRTAALCPAPVYGPARRASASTLDYRLDARRFQAEPYRSEEHTSELQSLMRLSYAVFC